MTSNVSRTSTWRHNQASPNSTTNQWIGSATIYPTAVSSGGLGVTVKGLGRKTGVSVNLSVWSLGLVMYLNYQSPLFPLALLFLIWLLLSFWTFLLAFSALTRLWTRAFCCSLGSVLIGAEDADIINAWSWMIGDGQKVARQTYIQLQEKKTKCDCGSTYLWKAFIDVLGLRSINSWCD